MVNAYKIREREREERERLITEFKMKVMTGLNSEWNTFFCSLHVQMYVLIGRLVEG